jgi:hypothetical protein
MLGTSDDVVSGVTFTFKEQVGLADGVGLGVDDRSGVSRPGCRAPQRLLLRLLHDFFH